MPRISFVLPDIGTLYDIISFVPGEGKYNISAKFITPVAFRNEAKTLRRAKQSI